MYIPKQQNTPWQANNDIDLKRTAILVIDLLGGSQGVIDSLKEAVKKIKNDFKEIDLVEVSSDEEKFASIAEIMVKN